VLRLWSCRQVDLGGVAKCGGCVDDVRRQRRRRVKWWISVDGGDSASQLRLGFRGLEGFLTVGYREGQGGE
jgi:hypothetical protein